MNEDPKNFKG